MRGGLVTLPYNKIITGLPFSATIFLLRVCISVWVCVKYYLLLLLLYFIIYYAHIYYLLIYL